MPQICRRNRNERKSPFLELKIDFFFRENTDNISEQLFYRNHVKLLLLTSYRKKILRP